VHSLLREPDVTCTANKLAINTSLLSLLPSPLLSPPPDALAKAKASAKATAEAEAAASAAAEAKALAEV
jgi:hypothetical protein